MLLIAFVLAAVAVGAAAASPPGPPVKIPPPPAGSLVQLAGPTGCVTTTGLDGCSESPVVKGAWDVKVSPDGLNVYVASRFSNAVLVYARDPSTGGLMPLPGQAACVSRDGSGGFCTQGRDLNQPVSLAFSGDGKFLLVASRLSNGVAVFQRDNSAGPLHGQLSQAAGKAGCINSSGAGGCASSAYTGVDRARAVVAVGSYIYVAVPNGGFVDVFAQVQSTGELEQLPLPYGCLAMGGGPFDLCTKTGPTPAPVALAVAGSNLVIGSVYDYNPGDLATAGGFITTTVIEVPLDHGAVSSGNASGPCYTAVSDITVNGGGWFRPAEGCHQLYSLSSSLSIATGFDGDVFAVGSTDDATGGNGDALTLFAQSPSPGSFAYNSCIGSPVCSGKPSDEPVAVFSADEQRLYGPAGVFCRDPNDPTRAGYILCAQTRVGRPRKANGDTNVIPTGMTISPDGTSVYLTFGTPSGWPTKLGGVYVLHQVR